MLKSFKVKGFRGFQDWISFDLSSSSKYEFNSDCVKDGLVKVGIIYGYNGVGKSNLGLAIFDIVTQLTDKSVNKAQYANYQYANNTDLIVEFSYTFQFGKDTVEYHYGKKSVDTIVFECLKINGKSIISFDKRDGFEFISTLEGTSALNKAIGELRISAVRYVKSNSVLPATDENTLFYKFISFVDRMLMFWSLDNRAYLGYETGSGDIIQDIVAKNHVEDFKLFLKETGLKSNIKVIEIDNKSRFMYDFGNTGIEFYGSTSTGIRSLTLFYYWYQRMIESENPPSFIFIDEYDAFYHYEMSEKVISLLKKLDVQIALTTHNTSLMTNELMRPDCCFLMYEDKILPLSKRSDKELRYAHNIEKMYKAGLFNE